ncbi:MAG: amidohydrolase family protein [Thermoplasmatota archaeon]
MKGPYRVVDAHIHVNRFDLMKPHAQELIRQNPSFRRMEAILADPAALVEAMDLEGIDQAWLINYCAKEVMGYGPEVNDWVSDYVAAEPTRLIAVGGYDPRDGVDGEAATQRLKDLGIRALKIHPVHQHLRSDDPRLDGVYEACARARIPVIVHTGTSRFPGADNAYGSPTPLADVCRRHPALRLVIAHGGRPHQTREALAVVAAHKNTFLDLSGCPPHRLADYFGDLEPLAPRTVWGSDWPGPGVPGMGANVDAFLGLGYSPAACRAILAGNADWLLADNV